VDTAQRALDGAPAFLPVVQSIHDEGNVLTDRRVISYEKEPDKSETAIAAALWMTPW